MSGPTTSRCGGKCRGTGWTRPGTAAGCVIWRATWSELARQGLRARVRVATRAGEGRADERAYLEPLEAIVGGAPTQAEAWLARYYGAWNGDVTAIFRQRIH